MGWGALLKAAVSLGGRAIKAVAKSAGVQSYILSKR